MTNGHNWYNKVFSNVKTFSGDFLEGVNIGSEYLRYPIHKARQGVDYIDHVIQHGSKVPLINDTLSLVSDNPIYAEGLGLIHSTDKTLEDVTNISRDLALAVNPHQFDMSPSRPSYTFYPKVSYPRVSFDAGFISARNDIASIRGERQIDGAVNVDEEFKRENNPTETSGHNRGIDQIGGGHIPAGQQPQDTIHYAPSIGIMGSDTFSGGFAGAINPGVESGPQVPAGYEQYLLGKTPAHAPAASVTAS